GRNSRRYFRSDADSRLPVSTPPRFHACPCPLFSKFHFCQGAAIRDRAPGQCKRGENSRDAWSGWRGPRRASHRHVGDGRRASFSQRIEHRYHRRLFQRPDSHFMAKLLPYIADLRQQYQRETWSEWFRWLAERMMEREKSSAPVPAHV